MQPRHTLSALTSRPEGRRAAAIVLGAVLALAGGCAHPPGPPQLQPVQSPAATYGFRSVWVAGFVVDGRPDIDVNERAVQKLRFQLTRMTSAPVVDEPPLRIAEEGDLLDRPEYASVTQRSPSPLVVTGTIRFTYPIVARRGYRPGRRDVHTRVKLQIRLVFIDGVSGDVIAVRSFPSENVLVGHGQTTVHEAFQELFARALPELRRCVASGVPPFRWTLS